MKVYRFGLLPPVDGANVVHAQLRAAHDYHNMLVQIERGRRAAVRESQRAYEDIPQLEADFIEADKTVRELSVLIKAQRAKTRSRSETADDRARLKEAKARRKEIKRNLSERRYALYSDPAFITRSAEIEQFNNELRKGLRACSSAYWGTQQIPDLAIEATRKSPLWDGVEPNNPRFLRWTGEGHVSVQVQSQANKPAFTMTNVYNDNTLVRIDPEATWCKHNRFGAERRKLPLLHLRVDSDEKGKPVWASWPIVVHRTIPANAVIKRVVVTLKRFGPREEWSVKFTVAEPMTEPSQFGKVAAHMGWRKVPTGIRVAVWRGEDGSGGELVLPPVNIDKLTKPESLQSIRKTSFNEARDALASWLATHHEVPEWLRIATITLPHWLAPGRLAALTKRWRGQRFDGDGEAYEALEKWRYNDHHLWAWQEDQRVNSLRSRREIYRRFAAELASRFGQCGVENFDLRPVVRRQSTEDETHENKAARHNRQLAAISDLRTALENAFVSRGGTYSKLSALYVTQTCHKCGVTEAFNSAAYVHNLCRHCGAIWDQDSNAAENLYARLCEHLSAAERTTPARNEENSNESKTLKESRWAKRKRVKTEKMAAEEAARNPSNKVAS